MSPSQPDRSVVCSHCGAVLGPESTQCWLCFAPAVRAGEWAEAAPEASVALADDSQPAETAESPRSPDAAAPTADQDRAPFQFGLSSLMLVTTLTAVLLGVAAMAPGLGIALAVLAAPALVRTANVAVRRRRRGEPLSARAKMWVFGGTLGLLAIVGTAAAAAFVVTCYPLGFLGFAWGYGGSGWGVFVFFMAWVAGAAVVILVLRLLFRSFRRLWPR
jgi:hypothetical protein